MQALERVATEVNLYADAGLKMPDDFQIAVVFHSQATKAVISDDAVGKHVNHEKNAALPLIRDLCEAGVEVSVCGQALAHFGFAASEVDPEISISVSALTVVNNKQMDGYNYLALS
jgi:intracellular sulfur oxidation DsrE/DsrF family protein